MLKVTHQAKDGISLLSIKGEVIETAQFPDDIAGIGLQPTIRVDLSGVDRFNSIGVKKWIFFMQAIRQNQPQAKVTLSACSVVVVEQINLYGAAFTAGGEVVSLFVPFRCEACAHQSPVRMLAEDVKRSGYKVANQACERCGGVAVFDDFPAEYFACLNLKPQT